jgi:hypothetical protein
MDEPPFSLAFVMVKESFAVPAVLFYQAATLTKTSVRTTLTLSCLGALLVRFLCLVCITQPVCSGPIKMVSVAKRINYVLPIHFACSIVPIGPLVAKLQQVYGLRGWWGS